MCTTDARAQVDATCREGVGCIKALGFLLVTHQTSSDQLSNTSRFAFTLSLLFFLFSEQQSIKNFKMNQVMIIRHFLLHCEPINYVEDFKITMKNELIHYRSSSLLWSSSWLLPLHNVLYLVDTKTGLVAFLASQVQVLVLLPSSILLVSLLLKIFIVGHEL